MDKIDSGSRILDKMLDSGYEKDVITLLYGPYASGKSNFVMLASCYNSKIGKKIIFVDSFLILCLFW